MKKTLVKMGDQSIQVSNTDISIGIFCDRCGILIAEVDRSNFNVKAISFGSAYSGNEAFSPEKVKFICGDCDAVLVQVAENPDLDVVLEPYLKKIIPDPEKGEE